MPTPRDTGKHIALMNGLDRFVLLVVVLLAGKTHPLS